MKKNWIYNLLCLALTVVSGMFGGGVAMATATAMGGEAQPMAEGGTTIVDSGSGATVTTGMEVTAEENPDYYAKAVDERITKMRPMRTPIDQITRKAATINRVKSMVVKYYSVSTRPIKTVLTKQVAEMTGSSVVLEVADAKLFSETDTIRVHNVKGYKEDGVTKDTKDLMLYVVGKNDQGFPQVIAVNGLSDSENGTSKTPLLPADTVLIRMGRAASEIDVQTGNFYNLPKPSEQYCQKFMMQVEQSTFDKMWDKEVDWNFSDMEEDGIYDMRLGMENSFLFGIKGKSKDPRKSGADVYFTGGIYWMAGKHMGLGTAGEGGDVTISDDEMVDFLKDLFTGNDSGNGQKIGFAGSDALAALAKMKSERFKVVKEFEKWGLKFTSFDSNFGKLLVMHHELMDMNGKADEIFVIDPEYLRKKHFLTWNRQEYDMAKLAERDTRAVVMKEASCCYLVYPNAHAVVKLGTLA